MSEDEIKSIQELTEIKELIEEDLGDDKLEVNATLDVIDLKSLCIVLDLVKKQQEEIKKLKEENEAVWHKNTEIEYELEKANDKIFELNKEMTDFNDQWLHKDKVRKIIEEFKRYEVLSSGFWDSNESLMWNKAIEKIKELL